MKKIVFNHKEFDNLEELIKELEIMGGKGLVYVNNQQDELYENCVQKEEIKLLQKEIMGA